MIDAYGSYQRSRGFSEATIRRRDLTLCAFARWLAPATLDAAELADVEEFLGTFPKATTRHAYLCDLRTFYTWAMRRQLLDDNPCALVDPIRRPKALPRPIGPEVHAALLVGRVRTRRMVALGLYAGLRAGEIAGLCAEDVSLEQQILVVRSGKGGRDRVVPLHPRLAELLDGLPPGPLFTHKGKQVRAATVSATVAGHLRRCGIDATAHQLRHTFGTELARQMHGNLLGVGKVMGHASPSTTQGYTAWTPDSAVEVAAMFTDPAA